MQVFTQHWFCSDCSGILYSNVKINSANSEYVALSQLTTRRPSLPLNPNPYGGGGGIWPPPMDFASYPQNEEFKKHVTS